MRIHYTIVIDNFAIDIAFTNMTIGDSDMGRDRSLEALLGHIDELLKSGELSKSKASGWKTACRSLGSCLPPADQRDATRIDPEAAAQAYKLRLNPAEKTIREYKGRLTAALESFRKVVGSPETDRSPVEIVPSSPVVRQRSVSHTLAVPLRPDFVAQLTIPHDISSKEVDAITDILTALAKLH